jgi:hypothetical protein
MGNRGLSDSEIQQLMNQGCKADDWKAITVPTNFITENIHQVHFDGKVKLGLFDSPVDIDQGITRPAGLNNVYVKDCSIKDNVYISDVKSLINYSIEENVVIDNVDRLIVSGETVFANGLEVDVLNEAGGREVPIFDQLTSQIAYLLATYRHDQKLIDKLKNIIENYIQSKKSKTGTIDRGTIIRDCGQIRNVTIGAFARISGALELSEGTIVSNQHAPTTIGSGVIAKSFIVLSGSKINNAALLEKTFVGQGVQVGRQFSAENTLIFCNSECFHSEACSIYAGPYTVTHHKSTLLIAAMFSFHNAGSGSNQSNHMYKLGPVHQGILERGGKTGSFSYMLWPSRIGAFSVVIGKHYSNFDNTDLPFSYIIESRGKTIVIPALNFFTVGTKRDSVKWPKRDRRKDPDKLDILNFELLSPYIIGKVLKAEDVLKDLMKKSNESDKLIPYKGQFIETKRLEKSIKDYNTIVDLYLGDQIIKQLTTLPKTESFENIKTSLFVNISDKQDNWVDMSGMICPSEKIKVLSEKVKSNTIESIEKLRSSLSEIHDSYDQLSWPWCLSLLLKRYGIVWDNLSVQTLIDIILSWKEASLEVNRRILDDAEKEFTEKSRIGYGIDGDQEIVDMDFENVIGNYDGNSFVKGLQEESKAIITTAEKTISFLRSLKN